MVAMRLLGNGYEVKTLQRNGYSRFVVQIQCVLTLARAS